MAVAIAMVAVGLGSATQARAGFVPFNDAGLFNQALGGSPTALPPVTEPFETNITGTFPLGGQYNAFTYSLTSPFMGGDALTAFRISDTYLGFQNGVLGGTSPNLTDADFAPGESVTVNFGMPVYAVGIFFNAEPSVTQPGDFFVQTSTGYAVNGNNPVAGRNPWPTLYFVGLISDTPFTSATFGTNVMTVGDDARGFFTLDNLTVVVPAPAGLAVFGVVAAVAGVRVRRRRVA